MTCVRSDLTREISRKTFIDIVLLESSFKMLLMLLKENRRQYNHSQWTNSALHANYPLQCLNIFLRDVN